MNFCAEMFFFPEQVTLIPIKLYDINEVTFQEAIALVYILHNKRIVVYRITQVPNIKQLVKGRLSPSRAV